ncbi:MAG: ABC transporter ATP-binding protein [Candidatus Thorarchaeota archaeon]
MILLEENKPRDLYFIKRLLKYMIIRKKILLLVFLFVILNLLLSFLIPYLISDIIDHYLLESKINSFFLTAGLYFILSFFGAHILTYFSQLLLVNIGEEGLYNIRADVFKKIQELDINFFHTTPKGEILSRMTNDLESMHAILSGQIIFTIYSILLLLGFLIIMFFISPVLMIFSTIIFPLYLLTMFLNKKYIRPFRNKVQESTGKLSSVMTENIKGIKVSNSFARNKENQNEFQEVNSNLSESFIEYGKFEALINPLSDNFSPLTKIVILILGSYVIFTSESSILTAGILLLYLLYIDRFIYPIWVISNIYNQIQMTFASFERIITILDHPIAVRESEHAVPLQISEGLIEMKKVCFTYDENDKPILHDFNLTINPNTTVAIVGETGAGKTTIMNLIARLYDIQGGEILIDHQDIRDVTLASLKKNLRIVLQDPVLFCESIRYNLTYGFEVSDEEIQSILTLLGIDFVLNLPNGLDTVVGERGGKLSLGQKQLLSFARAIIPNPKILLLDEATSSIDPQAELKIQKAMAKMTKNRTCLIIAHRLSTVHQADMIFVIGNGKIIERGTFNQLLEQKGHFHELWQFYS